MHKYVCSVCKKVKGCSINGCRGDCIKACLKCMKGIKYGYDKRNKI
jgi:hypothetical protein